MELWLHTLLFLWLFQLRKKNCHFQEALIAEKLNAILRKMCQTMAAYPTCSFTIVELQDSPDIDNMADSLIGLLIGL